MPFENQDQSLKEQATFESLNHQIIKYLWNSLHYSLDHIDSFEKRGVTWINDYQFIINIKIFSKYININEESVISNLYHQGFLNLGSPSKEILDDFDISSSTQCLLYMKHQFTPNSEIDYFE